MSWLINMFSELAESVIGEGAPEKGRKRGRSEARGKARPAPARAPTGQVHRRRREDADKFDHFW